MLPTGVTQDRTARPSRCTVQAPQRAMPQPNLVPVRPRTSRRTHKSGVSWSTSTSCSAPLTLKVIATFPPIRDRMRLRGRTTRRTIRDISSCQLECAAAVVAAACIELGCMVREGQQVPSEQLLEAGSCRFELYLGLLESALCAQHIRKPPTNLRIAARKCWPEQRFSF